MGGEASSKASGLFSVTRLMHCLDSPTAADPHMDR